MQVTSLPAVEKHGKAGELPELQTGGLGWPGLVGPDIIVYNQNQQAKMGEPPPPAPSIMLTPPRGAPWHLSGITDGGLAVNKLKYLAATDSTDAEPTKHIHEHHHYDCSHKPNADLPVIRAGLLLVKSLDELPSPPPQPTPTPFPTSMFMPRNARRSFDTTPFMHFNTHPFYNCPYFGTPGPHTYQRVPFSNPPFGHQHYHHHFYHSQYYPLNYHHHPHYRFLPAQMARVEYTENNYRQFGPYVQYVEADNRPRPTEYNGQPIIKLL